MLLRDVLKDLLGDLVGDIGGVLDGTLDDVLCLLDPEMVEPKMVEPESEAEMVEIGPSSIADFPISPMPPQSVFVFLFLTYVMLECSLCTRWTCRVRRSVPSG